MASTDSVLLINPQGMCPACGRAVGPPYDVRVTSVESVETGWRAEGEGRFSKSVCPVCGQVYDVAQKVVPIHLAELACPRCKKHDELTYSITAVSIDGKKFEFKASINCNKCGKISSFKKLIERVFEVMQFEISLTGIGIKKKEAT